MLNSTPAIGSFVTEFNLTILSPANGLLAKVTTVGVSVLTCTVLGVSSKI